MRAERGIVGGAVAVVLAAGLSACATGGTVTVTPPTSAGTTSAATHTTSTGSASVATGAVPDATTLVHEARSAYRSAKSAHLHATLTSDGVTQTIDIRGTLDGTNQQLTLDDPGQGDATVRTVDGKYYVKGDKTFWKTAAKGHSDATTALLANRWVLAPNDSSADFAKLTIRHVLDDMIGPAAIGDSDTAQMTTSAASQAGVNLFVAISRSATASVDTLKVLAADPHNVVQVTGASTDGSDGTANFDGWNTQAVVTVPQGYLNLSGQDGTTT
ncbi:hypothetical protein [Flexivirga caeni]|uniref:LppX_LprAFG lipoprotein n=1 Tax=Flexivirga caeni TaxID=2294115 RepID=A0A3M9ML82_9MICO|nr:hypothetical protein [Flexivirga caeni]RNI25428.1 hypothetical protein EFY87_02065 [Flexivirga caeni]